MPAGSFPPSTVVSEAEGSESDACRGSCAAYTSSAGASVTAGGEEACQGGKTARMNLPSIIILF